jgi:hypothetical protein
MAIAARMMASLFTAYIMFFALAIMGASTAIIKRAVITVDDPVKFHLLADGGRILAKSLCNSFE